MEFRGTPERPARPPQRQQTQTTPAGLPSNTPARKKRWLIPLVVLVLVIAGIATWRMVHAPTAPRADRYQAVFLDNGQTFFGKLKNTEGAYLKLEKAYTTQKQDLPEDATDEQKQAVSNNVSLVEVSKVVYGPENTMMIRAEQVLFWQDLKTDSKVSKAIDDAQSE